MTLEERLYLLKEMKERQEENIAHLQSPDTYCSRQTQYGRFFLETKKKSGFPKFFLFITTVIIIIFAAQIDFKNVDINDLPVYYNNFQTKLEKLINENIPK